MTYHGVSENVTERTPSTNSVTCDCHVTPVAYDHVTVTPTVSQRKCENTPISLRMGRAACQPVAGSPTAPRCPSLLAG